MTALLTLLGALTTSAALSDGAAQPDTPKAQQIVSAFEERLASWPKDKHQERDDAIRAFFANLKDRETKIAAIGMTDSRYVYRIPRPLVSALMGKLLKDPDLEVRLRAARSLGYNGNGGDHYEGIVALLKEVDDERLHAVIYAMGRANDPRYLPHVRALLKHADGMVRANAASALRGFSRKLVNEDITPLWKDPHPQVRYNLLSLLDPRTKEDLARVVAALRDPSDHVRVHAVEILGSTNEPDMPKRMLKMLDDPHHYVRGKALEALGNLQAHDLVKAVVARLEDRAEDVYVRRMAILTLEKLGDRSHLPLVRDMLRDADIQIRQHAERIAGMWDRTRE